MTNLLLFSAARHDIWQKRARTELDNGRWVVASRNYFSTLAYQGYGEGLDVDLIELITRLSTDEKYMDPDISIILDLDDETERSKRIGVRGKLENPDTFESKSDDFQSKVRKAYLDIAKSLSIPVVSANQTITEMTNELWSFIEPHIKA